MGCQLCPRRCGADRAGGERGLCGADDTVRIARAAPHYWEEPCISGVRGSGAVFFVGCSLGCVFCQNRAIRSPSAGHPVSVEELAAVFRDLEAQGVHNLNLVTPTHYADAVAAALELARPAVPVVWNSGGYELPATLAKLKGLVDVYLPDYKFADAADAAALAGAPDYPEVALAAIAEMLSQTGEPVFDAEGMLIRGVLVRHLVLPGRADGSMKALRRLRETFGDRILVSVMSQYTPMPGMSPPLDRPVSGDEYELVLDYADALGITAGFRQESGAVGESFIPEFEV